MMRVDVGLYGEYRYGFMNFEKDDEVAGNGNHLSFGDYGYSPRLGRRWNIDPVVKHHESPYATFANNPIWFADVDGLDTLMMHRKEIGISEDNTFITYKVTFSIIQDGIESSLPLSYKQVALYKPKGLENVVRPKGDDTYQLEFKKMGSHDEPGERWYEYFDNTIMVRGYFKNNGKEAEIFLHPVGWECVTEDYAGCIGTADEFDENGKPMLPIGEEVQRLERNGWNNKFATLEYTAEILQNVKNTYVNYGIGNNKGNNFDGNSFLMKGNSEAKPLEIQKATPRGASSINSVGTKTDLAR